MKSTRKFLAAALGLGLSATVVAACGGGGGNGADLTVYSGRTQNLVEPIIERFEAETGLDVEVRYSTDSATMALQIGEEGDRSPADVFVSQSPGAMGYLDAADRLLPIDEAALEVVAERFRADDGHWVGTSGRVRVLVYNTNAVTDAADLPTRITDLVAPTYAGEVGLAPENPSFVDFITGMRELVGDAETRAFLDGLADNGARTYANNDAVLAAVARGEVDYGLVNHYYNERAKLEDPEQPTANHLFEAGDPGSMILTTTVGILDTGTDHLDAAQQFVAFLLGAEAQQYFAEETLEYPLRAGVAATIDDLPPLEEIAAPELDLASLGDEFADTRAMIADAGLAQA